MIVDYVCALNVDEGNRPGVAARVTRVFSERGISLGEILATRHRERPVILLRFSASEKLRDFMVRRLARVPEVHEVRLLPSMDRPLWDYLDAAVQQELPEHAVALSSDPA